MMSKVRKAVIPAAGWGTRFLPFTKSVPKEVLPIIDRPAIQYIVEEAVAAGIEDILIVTSPYKKAVEDHFDRTRELEAVLEAGGKTAELEQIRALADLAQVHFVRQGEALGLGHAVGVARRHVGDEPFAVLLGDDMMHPRSPLLREMIAATEERGTSTIALMRVPKEDVSKYGSAAVEPIEGRDDLVAVRGLVEKPPPEEAPSDLAVIGRYVFTPEIFDHIERTAPGKGGEIQLTDAMATLAAGSGVNGLVFEGGRFDVGDKVDYLRTVLELGLEREDLRADLLSLIRDVAAREGIGDPS
ncbi:UTP--glucose-1-phosphate uridylyltransferase GalU [Actinomarinicola tropica]|uniref:UTP--glucose-1-phosphate uridylyltransferase n=1 Tax=Actinomarinicola tropica TaxID=2789776 RepID=A0A5Q2RNU1_9ACTN|nr:UTP--glucose-1-phosphate uridylyltransferase GalU [Actinomarinicola tropica]QGG96096.1 UTP--glucose-1-phosphate uridylyltransferase GalU [Actinomarinicola tropica]